MVSLWGGGGGGATAGKRHFAFLLVTPTVNVLMSFCCRTV